MSNKLDKAFRLTDEEHSQAFERFANAFLVDDYPELEALGGKKDQGMDARIYAEDGKTNDTCIKNGTMVLEVNHETSRIGGLAGGPATSCVGAGG
jgi:hypothetical protein